MALLSGVLEQGRSLSDLVDDRNGPLAGLPPAERARAQTLATSVLRHLGRVDAALAMFLKRPPHVQAKQALRIATTEMRVEGVPAHAAVDAAVRLVRANPKSQHLSGLVNAVARKVSNMDRAAWAALPDDAMPGWLRGRLEKVWGAEGAVALNAAHVVGVPPLDLTLRVPGDAVTWAGRLDAEVLPTGSLRLARGGQVSALPGYADGAWWVQDAAAAMPARLLGDVTGLRVLDLCAAPGGKTMQLAAAGAAVTALDSSRGRMKRVRENLARTGLEAALVTADALRWEPEAPFDAILLDAPCSATGTIRRHPDLPFVRLAEDVSSLVSLQAKLLARAWAWLKPGGRMVYATCSLLPEEGETQMVSFLGRNADAIQVRPDIAALGGAEAWLDGAGNLRLRPDFWPERGGMDGFYAALVRKSPLGQ